MTTTPAWPPTGGPIHEYFGLTYANYLVRPRALLQSMPATWQGRFAGCLRELDDAFAHLDVAAEYDVTAGEWVIVGESSDVTLAAAGARRYCVDSGGEAIPDDAPDNDPRWRGARDRFAWRGEVYGPDDRVFVAGADPIPHYNRGRTYVEPRITEPDPADVWRAVLVDFNREPLDIDAFDFDTDMPEIRIVRRSAVPGAGLIVDLRDIALREEDCADAAEVRRRFVEAQAMAAGLNATAVAR
jgi:hypothetical protein